MPSSAQAIAFNRVLDREVDARNPRTASRHLPQGVDACVRPPGSVHALGVSRQLLEGRLELSLNAAPLSLDLPAAEVAPIVFDDQAEPHSASAASTAALHSLLFVRLTVALHSLLVSALEKCCSH